MSTIAIRHIHIRRLIYSKALSTLKRNIQISLAAALAGYRAHSHKSMKHGKINKKAFHLMLVGLPGQTMRHNETCSGEAETPKNVK